MNAAFLKEKHEAGLSYEAYLATDPAKAEAWRAIEARARLTDEQRALVEGFTRAMPVIFLSGIWCGDCAQQGPLLHAIAQANPRNPRNPGNIDLRFLDRDEHADLQEAVAINAGHRVPMVLFMAEDFELVSIMGDRSLTRYRALAARKLGAACPLPGAPVGDDEIAGTLQDWLDEFERVHLLLRLSARLREAHAD